MIQISGDTYGLVDHCLSTAGISHGGNVSPSTCSGPGAANYRKPLSLGTAEAIYFEDNEVHLQSRTAIKPTGNNPWIVPTTAPAS